MDTDTDTDRPAPTLYLVAMWDTEADVIPRWMAYISQPDPSDPGDLLTAYMGHVNLPFRLGADDVAEALLAAEAAFGAVGIHPRGCYSRPGSGPTWTEFDLSEEATDTRAWTAPL